MEKTDAIQALIVEVSADKQHVRYYIDGSVYNDPGAWGIMLADVIQHISLAMTEHKVILDGAELTTPQIRARLVKVMKRELANPTETPKTIKFD